jgi:ABC-type glycerol-3-phosphate transport system substrate-binding protein
VKQLKSTAIAVALLMTTAGCGSNDDAAPATTAEAVPPSESTSPVDDGGLREAVEDDFEQKVDAWAAEHGDRLLAFEEMLQDANTAATSGDYAAVSLSCSTVRDEAAALLELPDIPDPIVQRAFERALANLAEFGRSCALGAAARDADLLYQASTSAAQATDDFETVLDAVRR